MKRRQTSVPRQWLIADDRLGDDVLRVVGDLPRNSGVLVLYREMPSAKRARLLASLRRVARLRGLIVADELGGDAARVHDVREMRSAALARVPLLFLSPINRTRSHPLWEPLPRMRAAALLRLAKAPVIALGGMDSRRFVKVRRLGFAGWAGMDAWRLRSLKSRGAAPKSRRNPT